MREFEAKPRRADWSRLFASPTVRYVLGLVIAVVVGGLAINGTAKLFVGEAVSINQSGDGNHTTILRPQLPEHPASLENPVDVCLAAAAAQKQGDPRSMVLKTRNLGGPGESFYGYTAQYLDDAGASVFIRWTDAPGFDSTFALSLNGQTAHPLADEATKTCLRENAIESEGSPG